MTVNNKFLTEANEVAASIVSVTARMRELAFTFGDHGEFDNRANKDLVNMALENVEFSVRALRRAATVNFKN